MGNKNKFLRLIVLGTVGIVLIFVSLYVFYDEYWFGFPSKVIDLNGFIASDSNDKTELPEGYAKLDVNKCYGQFYMSRGGRKIPNTYYYIIGLDDDSVMIFYNNSSSINKKSFDKLVEDTLNSRKTYSLTIKGKISYDLGEFITTEYDNYIDSLKEQGVLSDEVYVRYAKIDNYGGMAPRLVVLLSLLCIGVILIKLPFDLYQEKSILFTEHNRLYMILCVGVLVSLFSQNFIFRLIGFACIAYFLVSYCLIQYFLGHDKNTLIETNVSNSEQLSENNSKISKNTASRMINGFNRIIRTSGYSDKILHQVDRVINAYNNGDTFDFDIYKEYIFQAVKCSMYLDKYNEALKYINEITIQELLDPKYVYKFGKNALYEYLKLKMEVCRGLQDKSLAEKMLFESKPYIDSDELPVAEKYYKYHLLYSYYMLNEDFEKSKEYATNALTNSTNISFETYLINAEIDNKLGDREHELLMMSKARLYVRDVYKKQLYNKYLGLLKLDDQLEKFKLEQE